MSLTELEIKNFKPKDKMYRKADQDGLCIEITPKNSKLWRWRYRYNGKAQMMALGKYPQISLADARAKLPPLKQLLDEGKNPAREKKLDKIRNIKTQENTFEAIARSWLELKTGQLNEKYRRQTLTRLEQHVFPAIGALPITEITIPDVVTVIETIANKNGTIETAKRMGQFISQTYRYALKKGLCTHNPASDLRDILPVHKEKHHTCLPLSEIPDLLRAIDNYKGDKIVKYLVQLLSLTFVRTAEIIGAKWDEIDFDRAEWNIPAERMKMKRPHHVPLSRQAMDILKALHAVTGNREYVFYSARSKSRHISNGAILNALKRLGYNKRMTGHGFRTMASTILNEKGYAPDWIERQLAHAEKDKIRSAYNRAEYTLERIKMMQDYSDILDQIKKKEKHPIIYLDSAQSI